MIFVSLGTQDKPFKRILDDLKTLKLDEEVIVQAGFTKYQCEDFKIYDYLTPEELNKCLDEARIIIAHGGVGTIMQALKRGKTVIACPRLAKYGEHQNDHQKQIVDNFANSGYILAYNDGDDLKKLLKEAENFKANEFLANKDNFLAKFADYIESL